MAASQLIVEAAWRRRCAPAGQAGIPWREEGRFALVAFTVEGFVRCSNT